MTDDPATRNPATARSAVEPSTTGGGPGAGVVEGGPRQDAPPAPPQAAPTATTTPSRARPVSPSAAGTNGLPAEWSRKAVDAVDVVVDTIHDRAVRPVLLIARGIVFGLAAAALGVILVTLLSIGLIRLLDVYVFHHRVWASFLLVGFVFAIVGLAAWFFATRSVRHARH